MSETVQLEILHSVREFILLFTAGYFSLKWDRKMQNRVSDACKIGVGCVVHHTKRVVKAVAKPVKRSHHKKVENAEA